MFQQPLAVTTAIFMSVSLLSPQLPTPKNESINNISITQLDSIDSVRHSTGESNQSPNWQDKPLGSVTDPTPSITKSEPLGSSGSDSILGWVKTPSKDIWGDLLERLKLSACRITPHGKMRAFICPRCRVYSWYFLWRASSGLQRLLYRCVCRLWLTPRRLHRDSSWWRTLGLWSYTNHEKSRGENRGRRYHRTK